MLEACFPGMPFKCLTTCTLCFSLRYALLLVMCVSCELSKIQRLIALIPTVVKCTSC